MPEKTPERPGDDELSAFLDGELTSGRRAEVARLSEADWEVRARLAKVQRRVEKYVEATAHHSPADIPAFDDFWLKLSPRLKGAAAGGAGSQGETSERRRQMLRLSRLADLFRPQSRWPRLAAGTCAALLTLGAVAVYLLQSGGVGVVSAQELLRRSAQDEAARTSRVAEPVVYRRLQVRRRAAGGESAISWEVWSDAARDRFRQRVADAEGLRFVRGHERSTPALLAELEQVLEKNHFDARRPLSAAAYMRWRDQVQRKAESVVEVSLSGPGEGGGLMLTTAVAGPQALDSVIEASLVVRRADWHAVAGRLKVQGEDGVREYELSEAAYEVLPAQALTIFSDFTPAAVETPTPALAPARAAALPASPAPSLSPEPLPTASALTEAETAALYALHRAEADLGEQIEVRREADRQVVVQGLVETDARKQQLSDALRGLPLVAVRLQSVEEIVRQAAQQSSPSAEIVPAGEQPDSAAPRRSAFERRLAEYFVARGESRQDAGLKIAELSNAVVADTSAAMSEAWALRRLAERFPAERDGEMTAAARRRVEEMTAQHVARLRARAARLRARLEPPLAAIAGASAAPVTAAEAGWQVRALAVFESVERAHQLAGRLLTGAGAASETPEQSARQMLGALARLGGALQ
jgi:hypothetical protein